MCLRHFPVKEMIRYSQEKIFCVAIAPFIQGMQNCFSTTGTL